MSKIHILGERKQMSEEAVCLELQFCINLLKRIYVYAQRGYKVYIYILQQETMILGRKNYRNREGF